MMNIEFTEDELKTFNNERFHYPCPTVQKRFHALWLKGKNYSHTAIADILDIHPNSVTNYLKMYKQGGTEEIKRFNYGTNISLLENFRQSPEDEFRQRPPHSTNEAVQRIETMTGIRRSPTRVKAFMKRIGMKYRKIAHLPAKADPVKQAEFLDKELNPVIEKARQGVCRLFFTDAAHFVLGPYLCSLWTFVRLFIKAPAGRQRLNILGAADAVTKQVEFMANTTYINAVVIADFLRQIASKYKDLPIFIVLDNARYQHCKFITDLAKELNITLLFLPSYSPNLNIIERLWKFIKREVLYAGYYEKFNLFEQSILEALHKVNHDKSYKERIHQLLSLNFQTFENSQIYQG